MASKTTVEKAGITKDAATKIFIAQGKRCTVCDTDISSKGKHCFVGPLLAYTCPRCNLLLHNLATVPAGSVDKLVCASRRLREARSK